MKKLHILLSVILLSSCVNFTNNNDLTQSPVITLSPKYEKDTVGLDFSNIRNLYSNMKIFIDDLLFENDVFIAAIGKTNNIRFCNDYNNICAGFEWNFEKGEGVTVIQSYNFNIFNPNLYNPTWTDYAELLYCAESPEQGSICLQPYKEKNISVSDMITPEYKLTGSLAEIEKIAKMNKNIETACDLYIDQYLMYGGVGEHGFYLCLEYGNKIFPDDISFIGGGQITQIGIANFMPILKTMSKPNIKYECLAIDGFSYKKGEYLNQTDDCVLFRRNFKESSSICYFDYKKYLPENTKINTDEKFLDLVETYYNLKNLYNPNKLTLNCDEKIEITTQERKECKDKEKLAQQELKKKQHIFLEQVSTNTVPSCKKKEPKNYQEFIKTYKCKDVPLKDIKAFEYKNLCHAKDAKKDVQELSVKECRSIQFDTGSGSIAYNICAAHANILANAVVWRRQGLPINVPLDSIRHARGTNEYLYILLRDSIESAYANPNKMETEIQNGSWASFCEKALLNPQKYFYRKY